MKPPEGPKVVPPAYVVRMRPALAAQILNKAYARIPWPRSTGEADPKNSLPLPLKPNDRLFLVEYNGGTTGRADLVSVAAKFDDGTLYVLRGYGYHQGKHDDDLTEIGYRAVPTSCAILEAIEAPTVPAPEPGAHVVGPASFSGEATGPGPVERGSTPLQGTEPESLEAALARAVGGRDA